jgi:hypothetical protein
MKNETCHRHFFCCHQLLTSHITAARPPPRSRTGDRIRASCHVHLSPPLSKPNQAAMAAANPSVVGGPEARFWGRRLVAAMVIEMVKSYRWIPPILWFGLILILFLEALVPFLSSQWFSEDEEFVVDARFSEANAVLRRVCSGGWVWTLDVVEHRGVEIDRVGAQGGCVTASQVRFSALQNRPHNIVYVLQLITLISYSCSMRSWIYWKLNKCAHCYFSRFSLNCLFLAKYWRQKDCRSYFTMQPLLWEYFWENIVR